MSCCSIGKFHLDHLAECSLSRGFLWETLGFGKEAACLGVDPDLGRGLQWSSKTLSAAFKACCSIETWHWRVLMDVRMDPMVWWLSWEYDNSTVICEGRSGGLVWRTEAIRRDSWVMRLCISWHSLIASMRSMPLWLSWVLESLLLHQRRVCSKYVRESIRKKFLYYVVTVPDFSRR